MVVLAIRGGTDTYVQSVKYEYDDLSRTQAVTSYANPDCTTPVNGVKFTYDAWGNVSKTNQDHAGAADDNDPSVQYAYEDDPTDNKAKYVRLDYVTYPNSRAVNYNYAAGGVGGALSRLENIADDDNGTHKYAAYTYLGAGTIVEIDHPAITTNGLKLTYKGASGGLRYPGFDRFGRTVWQSWKKADDTDLDRYFYGYDRASNRIWEMDYLDYDFSGRHEAYTYDSLNRLVKAVRGTLTAADPQQPGQPSGEIAPVLGDANVDGVIDSTDYALIDNGYAMGLGGWFNGDFDGNGVIDETDCAIIDSYYASQPFTRSVVRTWDWSLDGVGNWAGYREDAGAGGQGNWDLDQLRSHNKANEIDNDDDHADAPDGSISGGGWVLAAYDAAGNMKRGPKPGDESMAGGTRHKYTYDAWNRLVKIETWNWTDTNEDGKVQDGEVQVTGAVAEYRYDPLNRRIRKFTDPSEGNWTVREYYYNNQWQNLEVRKEVKPRSGSPLSEPAVAAVVCEQYIWSPRYIDAPILRDRDADGNSGTGNLGGTGSGLEERHYYTTDGNGNVTALTDTSGAAVERYVYDPYGKPTIYNDDWTATVSWANSEQNEILYCGYRFDSESGLYHVRNRMYHTTLGRWLQRDPKGYVDGMGLYEYVGSDPIDHTDPQGTELIKNRLYKAENQSLREIYSDLKSRGYTMTFEEFNRQCRNAGYTLGTDDKFSGDVRWQKAPPPQPPPEKPASPEAVEKKAVVDQSQQAPPGAERTTSIQKQAESPSTQGKVAGGTSSPIPALDKNATPEQREQWLAAMAERAQAAKSQTGHDVRVSVQVAQAALESSWGQSKLYREANNFGGVKGKGDAGSVTMPTVEVVDGKRVTVDAQFAKYSSVESAFAAQGKMISTNKRYAEAAGAKTATEQAQAMQKAGYATDPKYAEKVTAIIRKYDLERFDK